MDSARGRRCDIVVCRLLQGSALGFDLGGAEAARNEEDCLVPGSARSWVRFVRRMGRVSAWHVIVTTAMARVTGILELSPRNEGRVRQISGSQFVQRDDDPMVPSALGSRFKLRSGLEVTVEVGGGGRPTAGSIVAIEGQEPSRFAGLKPFEELTSIDPQPRLTLEYPGCPVSCRLIDLFCPIGRGQRGLIVSPPKAGKTTLLKDIATAVLRNHADVEVWVLLVDERPEEVTDFRRSFAEFTGTKAGGSADGARCRVIGSSNDHDAERHIAVSTLTMDRCKRMVEAGKHVVVVMDSLTRMGRAFNNSKKHATGGRTMTGGIDSKALEVPKQVFGAARNTEEAGSLTVIASCLVDTGSAGDQVIFEEFKGTGNMELILDRKISERRLFPAINLAASGTRKEHLLMGEHELKTMSALRRRLMAMPPPQQVEQLLAAMQRFPTNGALVGSAG